MEMNHIIATSGGIVIVASIAVFAATVYFLNKSIKRLKILEEGADDLVSEIEQLQADRQSLFHSLDSMEKEQDRMVEYNAALELLGDKMVDAINKVCKEAGVK